ncbi:hypothetical protein ABZY36_17405 [Streptomyces sp. NPDC006627]|uniref:hypothetical protein n=1 Tax=Streptomyces sp. NPDC006627 TaxID=3154679 RepID=UPI0033B86148
MTRDHHAATATPQLPDGGTRTGPTTANCPARRPQRAGRADRPRSPRSLVDRRARARHPLPRNATRRLGAMARHHHAATATPQLPDGGGVSTRELPSPAAPRQPQRKTRQARHPPHNAPQRLGRRPGTTTR